MTKSRLFKTQLGWQRKVRWGFTIVELLVVIGIISVLMALLLPAVTSARERAWRVACGNDLRQCGTAILLHLEQKRHFPTGGWGKKWVGMPGRGAGENQPGGWIYNVLPFLEHELLHDLGSGSPDQPDPRRVPSGSGRRWRC